MTLVRTTVEVTTDDGQVLRGERLSSATRARRGVVVLAHAMMVDRRAMDFRKDGLASCLARHGLEILNFDLRGHGQSAPLVRDGAQFSYGVYVDHDLPALMRAARGVAGANTRVTLVGHSLGAHTAMFACSQMTLRGERPPVDSLVALTPNLWMRKLEPSARRRLRKQAMLMGLVAVAQARGHFPPRPFGMGSADEPLPYVKDLLRFFRKSEVRTESGRDLYADLSTLQTPLLAISSEGDPLFADPPTVARWLRAVPDERLRHEIIRGPNAPSHMGVVTEAKGHALFERIARHALGEPFSPGTYDFGAADAHLSPIDDTPHTA